MFKLKEVDNPEEKMRMASVVKCELELLKERIDVIKNLEVGINVIPQGHAYDLVLSIDFDNPEHLQEYIIHPAHQEFIQFNKQFSVAKAAVDYIIEST
jgi:hypothetical protein